MIVSLSEYQSLKETTYLLRARRILAGIEQVESDRGLQRDLAEVDD